MAANIMLSWFLSTEVMTTEPTTTPRPPSENDPPPPRYQISLLGSFDSETGESFSFECTEILEENFRYKTAFMIPELNNMIGGSLCEYVNPGDVQIVSMSVLLTTEGSTVSISVPTFLWVNLLASALYFQNI